MAETSSARIHVNGVVQGVGFRPFVYHLASRWSLTGWVRNTSAGVDIAVDGDLQAIQSFVAALRSEAPPLAQIHAVQVEDCPPDGFTSFEILHSEPVAEAFQPVSADVSICPDCLRELFDPADRRYLYPFINCTNCGPRFTIITGIPYDRPNTTMAGFALCPDCQAEYEDPLDRRFHAQPVACPACGPRIWLEATRGEPVIPEYAGELNTTTGVLAATQRLLAAGSVVAVKGLGGFHLACDATHPQAVQALRQRKLRVDKPFALMMADLQTVQAYCEVSPDEAELLTSRQRPIVLLHRLPQPAPGYAPIDSQAAPFQDTLGVMLPYTPLHYLLFAPLQAGSSAAKPPQALVMTSGNLREEPIATGNDEARQRLAALADALLLHDRPIHTRCDDSVVRVFAPSAFQPASQDANAETTLYPLRRSRGYAPYPVLLSFSAPPILATGAELKNTFCLTRGDYAFLSHHIGDMENYETLRSFEQGIVHFERLFRVQPQAIACDLHPDYLASRYAKNRASHENLPLYPVQHHHAHVAACMLEHGLPLDSRVIGVAFDGTGYGQDGAIWGGEFLLCGYADFQRAAHLAYFPLPGGDAATRKPARTALAALWQANLAWDSDLVCVQALGVQETAVLRRQLERQINTPLTSSMGRLFDAVASLAGVRQQVNYEAQAAIELEELASRAEKGEYRFEIPEPARDFPWQIGMNGLLRSVVADLRAGDHAGTISARFHNGVAGMVLEICQQLRDRSGLNQVVLSGGVWQNMTLLHKTVRVLSQAGFYVLTHRLAPANDGGLALGQAAVAAARAAA